MLKVASWNVNSIKMRLEQVLNWMQRTNVDVLALQETKIVDELFPRGAFEELGYHIAFSGQKSYNGVALISKYPLSDVHTDALIVDDPQRRVLSTTVSGIRVVNIYVPNGSAVGTDKYQYKLEWLTALKILIREQLVRYPKLILLGDYNIAPEDIDVHNPAEWEGCVLVSEPERHAFHELCDLGLYDSYRLKHPEASQFSWWDYRAGSFRRNRGLRIDLILLSELMLAELHDSCIDKEPRTWEKPSDHVPVWVELLNSR